MRLTTFGRRMVLALCLGAAGAGAQPLALDGTGTGSGPRGLSGPPPLRVPPAAPAADPAVVLAPSAAPLPPNPVTAAQPVVFGSQMFTGRFAGERGGGFNADYRVAVGDRVAVRLWGAFQHDAVQSVDPQGNLFVPNVGPVQVLGVRNAELNAQVEAQTKKVFRANVGVYATVEGSQPVKVYVSGFVRAPGLYAGLNSDSVLSYLDRAGGIDPDRGSYLQVSVLRAGQVRARLDLYRFLLEGRLEQVQLQDGDTIVAAPRGPVVQVGGEVQNPYVFEFHEGRITGAQLLALARPKPAATHLSIVRMRGADRRSEYQPLAAAATVEIADGDEVTVTSDRYPGTILVRLEGAHLGERALVMPYGATLQDALARLKPAPQADAQAAQLFRRSVALRQKEMLLASLRGLETYALTARSATSEEAALRHREAELILQFVERAKAVQPRGQVVLAQRTEARNTLLEDGDVIRIPERSNLVLVSGEVLFPNALVWDGGARADDYIRLAGGFNQGAERARVLVIHPDGSVDEAGSAALKPGDEIMVLPKIETKSIEITRGITQIVYQIAIAARVFLGL
ncbi:polysaccharide biosynthesis/export family protein [Aquabacterium sp. J223]|uniref:polysaccharide biosynthesis/export family protein n=1 Tax=Aquabacterium sp. J223 TaxID=2898431 RepID=UPI0021AD5649|nr:polysaccharide biosynthesis/export family protein [Aquabacterium sp. J223]UUX94123.1 polysaccharide biosynthesis/export family protein [Aquabacterium sp. J223]